MAQLRLAFLIVAIILFLLDGYFWLAQPTNQPRRFTSLGLAFFAGAFAVEGF